VLIFEDLHMVSWWFGMLIGLAHALFVLTVLTVGMMLLPTIHPRMATERHGPTAVRQLEPPGFMDSITDIKLRFSPSCRTLRSGQYWGQLYHWR
jgi:hypothetical protein